MLDIGHAFRASGDNDVGDPGLHHHRRLDDRLKARSAPPVELEARHRLREPGREPGPAPYAWRFTARIAVTEHDIIDTRRVDTDSLNKSLEDMRTQRSEGAHVCTPVTNAPLVCH